VVASDVKITVVDLKKADMVALLLEVTAVVPVEATLEATTMTVRLEVTLEATTTTTAHLEAMGATQVATLEATTTTIAHLEDMEATQEDTVEDHSNKANIPRAHHMVVGVATAVLPTTSQAQNNTLHRKAVIRLTRASSALL
jgi:hypothetical protein